MQSSPTPLPVSDISYPAWPRRASRACASCRRDKTRCDGARPCAGCIKKGFNADQCIDGCDPCRRARVRCEGGKPCQRCRDMNFECLEEHMMAIQQDSSTVSIRSARSNTTERAKLACANCRRDNKKCDNQRPCGRCVARSEECIHIGRGPKLVKLRCEGCREDNKRCDDGRPCRNCVECDKPCITLPRKGRGHGMRVKAACTSCRRDKIRCDGVRPCASCVRKGLECVERACKACTREGIAAECTHRNIQGAGRTSDNPDDPSYTIHDNTQASLPHTDYRSTQSPMLQHSLHAHLPPQPPSHATYNAVNNSAPGPSSHYYYSPPNQVVGPGQSASMISPYLHEQRPAYYPVIDPNIDRAPSNHSNVFPSHTNHS